MNIKFEILNGQLIKNSTNFNIIYYFELTEDEKKEIIENYHIDLHTINSSLDPDEVPRLEMDVNNNLNIIWKIPTSFNLSEYSSFNVATFGFFIYNNKLIMISSEYLQYFNEKINFYISNFFDILFIIQNFTIRQFSEHLKAIKTISREIQKKINTSMENEYLLKMFDLSELLVFYLESLDGNKIILNKILNLANLKKIDCNVDFLQNNINDLDQALKQTEIYSQVFASLMDARGTIVNNNMNVLIKNLTIINIIFLPLNLIASIGGMSEFTAFTSNIPWPISYGLFTLSMILIGWITYLIITKTKSLKK